MLANNKSCDILFWHFVQQRCTSNPEMNFHANPDYYNARRCPKQPIKPGWGDTNLVNEVQRKKRPPNQNQFKYNLHKLNAQTHILSISLTPSPFSRTLKSHNRFPFSSNSELPEGKKKPLIHFDSYLFCEGNTKELSETPLPSRGNWSELLWHDLVWVSPHDWSSIHTQKYKSEGRRICPESRDSQASAASRKRPTETYKLCNCESEVDLIKR